MWEKVECIQNKIELFVKTRKKDVSLFSRVIVLMLLSLWFSGLTKEIGDYIVITAVLATIAFLLFIVNPSKFSI